MYKHILVPTDGSALSDKAVEAAITLAKLLGARITAFHAMEPYPLQGAYAAEASGVAELQPEIFAERSEEYAKRVLDAVAPRGSRGECPVRDRLCHQPLPVRRRSSRKPARKIAISSSWPRTAGAASKDFCWEARPRKS